MFRNFNETIENHMEHLYSKYDCDIYLNFWDVFGYGVQPYSKYTSKNHYRFTGFHGENKNKVEIIPITESELIDDELMVLCGPVVGLQFLTQLRNPLELLRLFSCVSCK